MFDQFSSTEIAIGMLLAVALMAALFPLMLLIAVVQNTAETAEALEKINQKLDRLLPLDDLI